MEADRQLPIGGEIFLDHVGHFVPDPQAASRALVQMGFAPAPVSIQVNPGLDGTQTLTGTGNVTAMFTRGYMEILFKTADTPLGRELDAAMARYPGVHLAAFAAADAEREHGRLAAAGFKVRPLVQMQRPVETETGSGIAAFTVARVEPDAMAEGRIQILTHRTEDTVWQPRWLTHPNGAVGLTNLMLAVADVDEAADRFARFTGRQATPTGRGRTIALDRGRIELMTASAFTSIVPEAPIPSLPFMGAYGVAVRSLAAMEALLGKAGVVSRHSQDGLVVKFPAELGQGVWLFTEA